MNHSHAITLSDINIRTTLQPGDLGYIAYLHGDLYAGECGYGLNFETYVLDGLKDFAKAYNADKDRVWMCEHAGKIIGFVVAQHRDNAMQLRYFLFMPDYRGIGLGKHLMEAFLAYLREKSCTHAYLWTTEEQHAAISLYTRFGFILTEERATSTFNKPILERRYDLILG